MLNLSLARIADWTAGRLHGADVRVDAVSTDSRKLTAGALFVALRGAHHDGHDHVAAARAAGAVAAMVERPLDVEIAQVIVADAERALGRIAAGVRRGRSTEVIGITGSNGKTTVKTLVAGILARHAPTHASVGSFNNEIGLPLTLLSMPADTRFAVLEMGAGKPGDIAYLVDIAQPRVGLVNNIAPAHLERMGSVEQIAETKGALYAGLPADGIAIINADDDFAARFGELAGARQVIRFGLDGAADVSARVLAGSHFEMHTPDGSVEINLPLPGRHNIRNALAASAVALACGVSLATIKAGLESATAVPGRAVQHAHASGATIVDDTYNANPASFAAAIDTLAERPGRKVLVVGDMRELGADTEALHAGVGSRARQAGIDGLYAVGELSRASARTFGAEGRHFADQATLAKALASELQPSATVWIKGSRGSAMENVVSALLATGTDVEGRHAA